MQDYQAFGASSLIRGKETGCFAAAAGQPRLSHPGKHRPFPFRRQLHTACWQMWTQG